MNPLQKLLPFFSQPTPAPEMDYVEIDSQRIPVVCRRHARARNYVLRLRANRTITLTIPRHGSMQFARDFLQRRKPWLEKQWRILAARSLPTQALRPGMEILFRGRRTRVEVFEKDAHWELGLENERFPLPSIEGDLRPVIQARLRELAQRELAARAWELARLHGAAITKVVIRNQKSRWGSCSFRGTISLNWRLIQTPETVRDYIIIHELMHWRELNHSKRFWALVQQACPGYLDAERWLKSNLKDPLALHPGLP